jgi:hypothetical protein
MKKLNHLLFGVIALFGVQAASAGAPASCKPMFNHKDNTVATNNRCTQVDFQSSSTAGAATIVMNSSTQGACAYTTAVSCGGEDIMMQDIAAIDFKVTVPGGKCSPTEWIAVYMFPWCGQAGGCWDQGEREVDFVETTGPNGAGGFASNWDARPTQVAWVNQGGSVRVNTGASQHITFTSSQSNGKYQWDTRVCEASASKCDESNQLWHAYRDTGPTVFNESMMIVVDDWGVNNPPQAGCTLEVTDMVITKHSD